MSGHDWQKSFRSVPSDIAAELERIGSDLVIVAATKKIRIEDIASGTYAHLGITVEGERVSIGDGIVPPSTVGPFSMRNITGWEVVRRDLPKTTKSYSREVPNFGDAAKYGYHTHHQTKDVFQRQYFEPKMLKIEAEILNSPGVGVALVKFKVDRELDKASSTFADDFLFCINLLQENTGVSNVFSSNSSREDFIKTIGLDWEVFPPGNVDQLIASFSSGESSVPSQKKDTIQSRLAMFRKLPVEQFLKGSGKFDSYIGAKYTDDLVVFENVNYGNALYVLYGDWEDVSKRSRTDLLRGTTDSYDRFVHTDGWEDRFQTHIEAELVKRGRIAKKRKAVSYYRKRR